MSDEDCSDVELDPRIQIELEKLNTTTDEINKLELEYDEAHQTFRLLLNECTRRLNLLSRKLGSCIEKSRPYYEILKQTKKAQQECQEAAVQYQKANGIYAAAKETVALAEQRFLTNQHEWQFDNAWQEMLNHATMKVMEAENQRAESGREHQRRAAIFKDLEEKLKQLEEKQVKNIIKARPYFDEKVLCEEQLNTQKERIEAIRKDITRTKNFYAQTLKNLEQISNEIHMMRSSKNMDILKRPREPGVGAAASSTFEEGEAMPSLPDINLELDKCEVLSTCTSSAMSEKDEHEFLEEEKDLETVERKLRDLRSADGGDRKSVV